MAADDFHGIDCGDVDHTQTHRAYLSGNYRCIALRDNILTVPFYFSIIKIKRFCAICMFAQAKMLDA